jgi:hypothetical protein
MQIGYLVIFCLQLNRRIDRVKQDVFSADLIRKKIEDGSIFIFLEKKIGCNLSIFVETEKDEILNTWRTYNRTRSKEVGVYQNGLCLLVDYVLQSIMDIDLGKI